MPSMNSGPGDLFFAQGNRDVTDQVKFLRLYKIESVDTTTMTARIAPLEGNAPKSVVPLPMPSVSPGGGIFVVPKRGAIVIVGIRAMQMPIILAYYPHNVFTPDSGFALYKQIFGISDPLSEGDIYMRAASDSARCTVCGTTSQQAFWSANIDPETLRERCPAPNCNAQAYLTDSNGVITAIQKYQLGTTLHMTANGKVFFQGDNLSSADKGDANRLIKMSMNIVTGDVAIENAHDFHVQANGEITMKCENYKIDAKSIQQNSDALVSNVNQDLNQTLNNLNLVVTNNLYYQAQTLGLKALGLLNVGADQVTTKIVTSEDYNNDGYLSATIGGDRVATIGGDDTLDVTGNLGVTVTGGAILTSTGEMDINGSKVVFNKGTLAVARQTDTVLINSASDATFITYLSNVSAFLSALFTAYNAHTHTSAAPGSPTSPPLVPLVTPAPSAPATATGKITSGNNTVLA